MLTSKILIVIVLYRTKLEESTSCKSLLAAINKLPYSNYDVVIYENSAGLDEVRSRVFMDNRLLYVFNKNNNGTYGAYSWALARARMANNEWMVTLDQDSEVSYEYLCELNDIANTNKDIAVALPRVIDGKNLQTVSPLNVRAGFLLRPNKWGIKGGNITGVASGAMFNVGFLSGMGGFNSEFVLDYQDHWVFQEIYKRRGKYHIMHATIYHDLSISSPDDVSEMRLLNIWNAEKKFYYHYRPRRDRYIYWLRALFRALKYLARYSRKKLALKIIKIAFFLKI